MTTRPEALLETKLVTQLRGKGYGFVAVQDDAGLWANLQAQLEAFNGTAPPHPQLHLQPPRVAPVPHVQAALAGVCGHYHVHSLLFATCGV